MDALNLTVQPETTLTPVQRLALRLGQYENSRIAREHNLHLNRCLRDRTDGLRTFKDLPNQTIPSSDVDRRFTIRRAWHKIGSGKVY